MASAPLNSEPSLPAEREKNELPPKSYADAAEQDLSQLVKHTPTPPEQYIGQGEDDAPRSPRKKTHKKSGSIRVNGHQPSQRKDTSTLEVEDFEDKDGEHLTTLKRNDTIELVSGRQAGAGWERSK